MKFPYLPLGPLQPEVQGGKRRFRVWAPNPTQVELAVQQGESFRTHPMEANELGYYLSPLLEAPAGTRYGYYLNGDYDKLYPDPSSRYQPEGVHAASEVIDLPPLPKSDWAGRMLAGATIYEVHIGTFTPQGTLLAAIDKLDYLKDLGISTLELMPLNQPPGDRNWGYDGVLPFALFKAYGRPEDLRTFIDAAHERQMAILIDVIYNHLGPEGNYLPNFFPVFTDQHHTPWGQAINFDDRHADGVRNYWLRNVEMWLADYGADGLRIDAVHAIKDYSAEHFLQSLSKTVDRISEEQQRRLITIAECDLNAPRFVRSLERGGYGINGQWVDEFHHALHAVLTSERLGYYEDFGELSQLAKTIRDGYVYTGQYSAHRGRNFGTEDYLPDNASPGQELRPSQFVVFLQNHDQVGNRMVGDRLLNTISVDRYLLGAGTYLLSAFTPLVFMGEEYGERRPFPYFVHHGDPPLIEAVRKGRAAEFAAFQREGHSVPDPQSPDTFASAKLSWEIDERIHLFYRQALHLRAAARNDSFADHTVEQNETLIHWTSSRWAYACYGNYGPNQVDVAAEGREIVLASNGAHLDDGRLVLPGWGFVCLLK